MRLAQNNQTEEIVYISDTEFDNGDYTDCSNDAEIWVSYGLKLTDKATTKTALLNINSLKDFSLQDNETKIILASWFCTEKENINSIFSIEEQIEIIKSTYAPILDDGSHESNGKNYFNSFRASLVHDYKFGEKTDVGIFEIEQKLATVTDKLITGDWMSARALLSTITVEGYLTQDLKDGLLADFTTYIETNY